MIYKSLVLSLIFSWLGQISHCQTPPSIQKPEIGKPMPHFVLQDVRYFRTSTISLADFPGKWLILDFWYRGCVASIKNLSNVNSLAATFREQAQFVLIGVNNARYFGKGIDELYERLRKKMGLELPSVYDSTLCEKWQITSFPHIIIVDPNGTVKAITNGSDMTKENMSDLLKGLPVKFYDKDLEPPLFDGNRTGAENLTYRSLLSHWNGERQRIPDVRNRPDLGSNFAGYRASCVPLYQLYNLAYIGKSMWFLRTDPLYQTLYPFPLIEARDTNAFNYDYTTGKGIYNYELLMERDSASKQDIMHIIQGDLENIFGYKVRIETRAMPVWKLIATRGAAQKLRAKAGSTLKITNMNGDGGAGGFSVRNITIKSLLELITRYINDYKIPFFDETGIDHSIDITIDALMTDRDQIKKELQKNGLDLIMGEKPMKVLVIRDAKGA